MIRSIRTCALALALSSVTLALAAGFQGVVYDDANKNGVRDAGERGISGVAVTNGEAVVRTGRDGAYVLPVRDPMVVVATKPPGWKAVRWFYVHDSDGSPEQLRYGGTPATGALPNSVDFGFVKRPEPRTFNALVFGDTQPYNQVQMNHLVHDLFGELYGTDAAFGITLGDVVGDNLNLLPDTMGAHHTLGIPWHFVNGNHDRDLDAQEEDTSVHSWRRLVGPEYYSFQVAGAHFVVLENVDHHAGGGYQSGLGETQLRWLENDLSLVPRDRLIVLTMHIPLNEVQELNQVMRLLSRFEHTLSFSAHTHMLHHRHFGPEVGFERGAHHHIISGATSGSWWSGERDEFGIPHTMMRDGTPRGYLVLTVDGNRPHVRYKVTRRPDDFQTSIHIPDVLTLENKFEARVLANVFFALPSAKVEMRVNDGPWVPMTRVDETDPFFTALKRLEQQEVLPANGTRLPGAVRSEHLWAAPAPTRLLPGVHAVHVRGTDAFGRTVLGSRAFRVQ